MKTDNVRVYVFYDNLRAEWDAIHAEMEIAERDILKTCNDKEQPYIITTLADDGFPHARLAASALKRFRREMTSSADKRLIETVVARYAALPKQDTGGDREGQTAFFITPQMVADADAIADYLEANGYAVPRLRYGSKTAYRVPIMLSVIYCGMVIG